MTIAELVARLRLSPDKKSFSGANSMIGTLKKAAAGLAAALGARQLWRGFDSIAQRADQFRKLSGELGTSSEALQQLEFAAQISGATIGDLRTALGRLSTESLNVQRGNKESIRTFQKLGVSTRNASGEMRPVDALLSDIAERFAKMPDGAEKTALAIQMFGRSGARLVPMLNEGRDGIGALRKEFVDLGGQIDDETGRRFEEFNDTMLRTRVVAQGLKQHIAIALLPHFQKVATAVMEWFKANRALISQKLDEFFYNAEKALGTLWRTGVTAHGMFNKLSDAVGGNRNAMLLLGGSVVAFKGIAIGAFSAILKTALLPLSAGAIAFLETLRIMGTELKEFRYAGTAFREFTSGRHAERVKANRAARKELDIQTALVDQQSEQVRLRKELGITAPAAWAGGRLSAETLAQEQRRIDGMAIATDARDRAQARIDARNRARGDVNVDLDINVQSNASAQDIGKEVTAQLESVFRHTAEAF